MESEKDRVSDPGDCEDIPSDFFDDFSRDDFMEGLSVIDSWDDEDGTGKRRESRRINIEALDSVKDLRELIGDKDKDQREDSKKTGKHTKFAGKFEDKYKWRKCESPQARSSSNLDNFIKPGSRRDPTKTNEAIKKDKEVKVKEYLAKHLESSDDLRPPGTELDDYYDEDKTKDRKKTPRHIEDEQPEQCSERHISPKERRYKESPRRQMAPRQSPRRRHSPRWSPRRQFLRLSPTRPIKKRYSPQRRSPQRRSPQRRSPQRRSPQRRSPQRRSPHRRSPQRRSPQRRSPRRYSPLRPRLLSPRRRRLSRSPMRRSYEPRRSRTPRSRSPHHTDTFLYPNDSQAPPGYLPENVSYQSEPGQVYTAAVQNEFPGSVPGYSYSQGLPYGSGFSAPYNYGPQSGASVSMPEPVPMPNMVPVQASALNPVPVPAMVPAPSLPVLEQKTPYDALAQLVAEGKISQEDYLKLAPNKGVSSLMDSKSMSGVVSRCNQALTKLEKLLLPNHLMMNNHIIGSEPKSIESKFSSPLKRQAVVEFNFTKTNGPTIAQQNKQLVESIITTVGLDKVVSRYKRSLPKDMKDVAVQTTKPCCDVCEIRESTKFQEASTFTNPEYFTSTVHTQVVEQDLVNSKSVFNPSGSVASGAPISIAHLTPAQLVSQLAARAKTLKQSSPVPPPVHQNQFARRNPNYDYDGRGGGGQQYHQNYNNYRY